MRCWGCGSELEGLPKTFGGVREDFTCVDCTELIELKKIRESIESAKYSSRSADVSYSYAYSYPERKGAMFFGVVLFILLGATVITLFSDVDMWKGLQMLAITILYCFFLGIGNKSALGFLVVALIWILDLLRH